MRLTLASLRDGLALVLAMGFVALAPLFASAAGLAGALLDRPLAHRLLDDLEAVERAGGLAARLWFNASLAAPGVETPLHLRNLPPETWEAVAAELLPPGWLRAQAHGLVDATYDWLEGDQALPVVRIALDEVRDRLRSPAGTLALLPLLAEARPCQPGEGAAASAAASSGAGVFVPCIPPRSNLEALARQTALYTADQMPAVVDLPVAVSTGAIPPEVVIQLEQFRRWARWALALLGLWREVCLLLLAAHLLLAARTWTDLAARLALPLGAAGVVTLLIALVAFGLAVAMGGIALTSAEADWPPGAAALLNQAVGYVGRAAALRVAAWGGGMAGLAALGWGAGRLSLPAWPAPLAGSRRRG